MRTLARIALATLLSLGLAAPTPNEPSNKLQKRDYGNTADQLLDGTPCKAITLVFARGTFEPGDIGGVIGPEFAQAIADQVGGDQLAVQGVGYDASATGILTLGFLFGSYNFTQLATRAMTQCPNTKLAVSGYSQGAGILHNAAAGWSTALTAFVSSATVFGDPNEGSSVGKVPASRTQSWCHSDDQICHGGLTITSGHVDYSDNATAAAAFVVAQAGR